MLGNKRIAILNESLFEKCNKRSKRHFLIAYAWFWTYELFCSAAVNTLNTINLA